MTKLRITKDLLTDAISREKTEEISQESHDKSFNVTKIMAFASNYTIDQTEEEISNIIKYETTYRFLLQYNTDGMRHVTETDLMMSVPCTFKENQILEHQIVGCHWKALCENNNDLSLEDFQHCGFIPFVHYLLQSTQIYYSLFNNIMPIQDLLSTHFMSFDHHLAADQVGKIQFYLKMNQLPSDCFHTPEQLEDLCLQSIDSDNFDVHLFHRLINYVKIAQKLYVHYPEAYDLSIEGILCCDVEKIIANIVTERKVPPFEIENIVKDLNKNLIHILVNNNFLPKVHQFWMSLSREKEILEHLYVFIQRNTNCAALYDMEDMNLNFDHSYVLPNIDQASSIVSQIIHEVHGITTQYSSENMTALREFVDLSQIKTLSVLFDNKPLFAALNYDNVDMRWIYKYLAGEITRKDAIFMIENINELQYKKHQIQLDKIKDFFLKSLVDESDDTEDYKYLCKISNLNLKLTYIYKHVHKIENSILVRTIIFDLLSESYDACLLPAYKQQLKQWIVELDIYEHMAAVLAAENWLRVRDTNLNEPDVMIQELLLRDIPLLNLLEEWNKIHSLSNIQDQNQLKHIFDIFSIYIMKQKNGVQPIIFKTIETMNSEKVIELYEMLLMGVKCLPALQYIVQYLADNGPNKQKYQKYLISIQIFYCLQEREYRNLWHLIQKPLLAIEQFLMNSRVETLSKMFKAFKPFISQEKCTLCLECNSNNRVYSNSSNLTKLANLSNSGGSDYVLVTYDVPHINEFITEDCLNVLLKVYARKALDYKIQRKRFSSENSTASQESQNETSNKHDTFSMPKEPPSKENWISDDKTDVCMCCKKSTFTILTRKHHCRRCGRVVCRPCSTNRVYIPELYSTIPVRACTDCFLASKLESKNKENTDQTSHEQWQFSGSSKHDSLVREDFSYEFAPNVNLFLSICDLNLPNKECVKFSLEQANKLEVLFRPLAKGRANPEVDHELVATMIRCLVVTARVRGAKESEFNQLLQHAEISKLLVEHRCESLIPTK